VYGVLRLINFAHSEIFMIGVFAALFAMHGLGITAADPTKSGGALVFTLVVVIIVAMLASGAAAVLMERVAYRPLRRRNAPRLSALITAIGISLFLQELYALRYGRNQLGFPRVLEKSVLAEPFGAVIRVDKVLVVVAAVVLMIALERFVAKSRLGRGIRAVAQDAETAALMGVNIDRVVLLTFLLGGLLAGAAGAMYGIFFESAIYNIGFLPGIRAFTAAVLGGIGNIRGAVLGGLLLGVLEKYGSSLFGGKWEYVFTFVLLVAVLMFRPTGLLGESLGKARA